MDDFFFFLILQIQEVHCFILNQVKGKDLVSFDWNENNFYDL